MNTIIPYKNQRINWLRQTSFHWLLYENQRINSLATISVIATQFVLCFLAVFGDK